MLGHNVVAVVSNGLDALGIANANQLDLVFMDINIEGSMDGIQCAHQLNEHARIPIIYISVYSDTQTVKEASYSNIYGFIAKPFDAKNIELTLNVAIARIQQNEQ